MVLSTWKVRLKFRLNSIDFELFTKKFSLILIARRSRCYAGVRYPRRGIDREGNVANFVETEQIVYCPNKSFDDKPIFSSFIFNRGSIPVFWSQDPNPLVGKPPINLQRAMDVKCLATKRHFGELLERYSYPITCINLTKKDKERELIVSD